MGTATWILGSASIMDATPLLVSPTPVPPTAVGAWPRSAQLGLAFLLGIATTFLLLHLLSMTRWRTQPTELQSGPSVRIDLNHADRTELAQIPGVGAAMAERIEEHRRLHGPFRDVHDLLQVKGVGPKTLQALEGWVCVEPEASHAEPIAKPAAAKTPARQTESKSKAAVGMEPLDLNRASAEELRRLPGIGEKMSQRIVEERDRRRFKSVEELRRVSGIGAKSLERLRPYVTVRESKSVNVAAAD